MFSKAETKRNVFTFQYSMYKCNQNGHVKAEGNNSKKVYKWAYQKAYKEHAPGPITKILSQY